MKEEILLTPAGLEKLKKELVDLKARRKTVADRIRTAREFGDLSENSEYEDARNEQSFVEGRIQELADMILKAKITTRNSASGKIEMGSVVTLKLESDKFDYEIVGANESDPTNGKISIESPLGFALSGKAKGEKVALTTPNGVTTYEIISIK